MFKRHTMIFVRAKEFDKQNGFCTYIFDSVRDEKYQWYQLVVEIESLLEMRLFHKNTCI